MQTTYKVNQFYGRSLLLFMLIFSSCQKDTEFSNNGNPLITESSALKKSGNAPATVSVLFTGLNNPQGLKFGPDGNLYVSNVGFTPAAIGGGQVLNVTLNN